MILSIFSATILALISYFLGRRKNNSEIKKTEADTIKSGAEAEKIDTENKIAQVELFDKLNKTLTEQNEKLLISNDKLVKSNETLIRQNKLLLKQVGSLEERLSILERNFENTRCNNAPDCENRITIIE